MYGVGTVRYGTVRVGGSWWQESNKAAAVCGLHKAEGAATKQDQEEWKHALLKPIQSSDTDTQTQTQTQTQTRTQIQIQTQTQTQNPSQASKFVIA